MIAIVLSFIFALSDFAPPVYKVDLQESPATRFNHVFEDKKQVIHSLVKSYTSTKSYSEISMYGFILDNLFFSDSLKQELSSMAQICNLDYYEALFANFMYEYNTGCTSIIVKQMNGQIIHGRNLDYDAASLPLDSVIQINFYNKNQFSHSSVGFAFYLGIGTGLKPGKFSVSLNQRRGNYLQTLYALMKGNTGNHFAIRDAFEQLNSFTEAKDYLINTNTVAYSYDIIAGIEGGALITRNRDSIANLLEIDDDKWYIVETNYDNWVAAPDNDNRRDPAINYIKEIGRESFNITSLWDVLSLYPVLNNITLFTTVMIPDTGYISSLIRGNN